MEQNTVIISTEIYDELKRLERVVLDDSETIFFESLDGNVRTVSIYYNSKAHFEVVEMNNSLKIKIDSLKKQLTQKEYQIKELKSQKQKRKLFKLF